MLTNIEIGTRIKSTRDLRGLTLDDIASRVGVAKSTISRYENGTISKLKLPVLESIAKALDVDPNWIIGNTDDPDASLSEEKAAISDEDLQFALFGGKVSEEAFAEVKRFAAFVAQQEKEKAK